MNSELPSAPGGWRASTPRRVLGEDPLQGATVHLEAAGSLRNIAIAEFEDSLDMLPADPVGRHRVFGGLGGPVLMGEQRALDRIGIGRFRQVVDRPRFHRSDRGRYVAVAG